jgi:3-oxoacyl-(acyl-carrier-protein) synthase
MGEGHSVVITGVGPITPIGAGVEPFWDAVVAGRTGCRRIASPWIDGERADAYRTRIGAPAVEPVPAGCHLTDQEARLLDPAARWALEAASFALVDAGLRTELADERRRRYRLADVDPERCGVVIGSGIGGLCTLEASHRLWVLGEPITGAFRYSVPMLIPNALPAQVAIRFGLQGECKVIGTACAAGTMALGDAYRLLRDGELDVALAGGVDKTLSDVDGYGLFGFDLLKTLSRRNDDPTTASRPFDSERDGFVLGEGAGLLVLERETHARARGARIYARVLGYAATCDAHSMMQLEPSGQQMVRVMQRALASAGLAPEEIGYVNAHGTSTRQNDPQEAKALHRVFGRHVRDIVVNSTKAMTGHGIGAAGGIEAITTALGLARGLLHRCVNLFEPDPECDLDLPRENRVPRPLAALSNSFGFGGHNATLVLAAP